MQEQIDRHSEQLRIVLKLLETTKEMLDIANKRLIKLEEK